MSRHRIAIVVPAFSQSGGEQSLALFLLRVLALTDRFSVDVFSLATSSSDGLSLRLRAPSSWLQGVRIREETWNGLPFRNVGAPFAELEYQRFQPRRILTEILNRYDLVQVLAGFPAWAMTTRHVRPPVVLWAATLAKLERVSILAQSKGLSGAYRRGMTRLTNRLDVTATRHLAHTFALNTKLEGLLAAYVPTSRLSVAIPGVDTSLLRPGPERSEDYILGVARFSDPRKNLPMLLHAYQRLRQRIPQAPRLVIVSPKAPPSAADRALADSLGITDHLEVRLGLTDEELAALYRNAALFVLSSNEEGLGIVILEAMASGTPVVSTDCGGPRDVIVHGRTGFLTPVGDAPELAARMEQLLTSAELRREMGATGRVVAEERFSVESAGRVFLEKYDQLLNFRVASAR